MDWVCNSVECLPSIHKVLGSFHPSKIIIKKFPHIPFLASQKENKQKSGLEVQPRIFLEEPSVGYINVSLALMASHKKS